MRALLAVFGLALLGGCGADGEPVRPEPRAKTGAINIDISGSAEIGVRG
ncbi:argininosuccinate lyase [Salipiger sp.]